MVYVFIQAVGTRLASIADIGLMKYEEFLDLEECDIRLDYSTRIQEIQESPGRGIFAKTWL